MPKNVNPVRASLSFDELVLCIKQIEAHEARKAACVCREWKDAVISLKSHYIEKLSFTNVLCQTQRYTFDAGRAICAGSVTLKHPSSFVEAIIKTTLDKLNALKQAGVADIDMLYGNNFVIDLLPQFIDNSLSEHSFVVDETYELSDSIAELAESYSALQSNFKYLHRYVPSRSEKWVKPAALYLWLNVARERGYTKCRLVLKIATLETYKGMRFDPIGYGYDGKHHSFVSLSDNVSSSDDFRMSNAKAGSCVLSLLLIDGDGDELDKNFASKYFTLNAPMLGIKNCICVRDTNLLLPLGLAEAI